MQSARAHVNQQLAWCRLLLTQFEQSDLPWRQQCLVQALGWHLKACYQAFIAELAQALRSTAQLPETARDVIQAIPAGREVPAELRELLRLESGDSWLASLLALPAPGKASAADTGADAGKAGGANSQILASDKIAVSKPRVFDLALAKASLAALDEIIQRNRAFCDEC
ncbi:hypothetical protein L1F30_07560 [Simiduia sp. 21SJ11W-1]|uniref:DUF6586 family protein n=1 Tax=Simiduia sp. 21SJ11W-1 TaxID=2909669 RepID=UPI00209C8A01|nr:DUF6586 family protein [Simiduia sp. 21SJ11W-1]UTA49383.1 hypothetical protein L1F30_07560 [Simiduia sp. 21SJ11W-1]